MIFRIRAKALVEAGSIYPRLKPGVTGEEIQGQVGGRCVPRIF